LRDRSTTSWPALAATSAMPEPMMPEPRIWEDDAWRQEGVGAVVPHRNGHRIDVADIPPLEVITAS
jgi:hypothetical protein